MPCVFKNDPRAISIHLTSRSVTFPLKPPTDSFHPATEALDDVSNVPDLVKLPLQLVNLSQYGMKPRDLRICDGHRSFGIGRLRRCCHLSLLGKLIPARKISLWDETQ